jgi:chromosome segregation ATPase
MKRIFPSLVICTLLFLQSCYGKASKITASQSSDLLIHQLRVELEEIKHHIHTTVMQMNILTNKMVNTEDILFELKQQDLITQKQALEVNSDRLVQAEKKLEEIVHSNAAQNLAFASLETEVKTHKKSLEQNKHKIQEMEKNLLSFAENPLKK